jgi:opacity protein-like surface antigen
MKKIMRPSFKLLLLVSALMPLELFAGQTPNLKAAPAVSDHRSILLDEISVGTGYAWGRLKYSRSSSEVIPAFVRFGFDMNSVFGMPDGKGTLQLALEPFVNPVSRPERGVEAGLDIFVRYLHPVSPTVKMISELGTGPMFLNIDTAEQGKGGLNFLNQFGLGTQVVVSANSAVSLGYRYRHISNAGTSQPNRGINTNALIVSYSILY